MTDAKKVVSDDSGVIDDTATGCCGWGCGSQISDDKVEEDHGCCGGWHCHDDGDDDKSGNHHHDDGWCCGWWCGGHPVHLTVEQIAQVNEILGDIDDEDLASGNYDLSDEDLEKLRAIFG